MSLENSQTDSGRIDPETQFSHVDGFTPNNLYSIRATCPGVIGGRGGGNGDAPRERTPVKTPDFNPSWQEGAACTGEDPEIFFAAQSQKFETPKQRAAAKKVAQAICRDCVVREECQNFALSTNQSDGIWNGMDEGDRRRYKKRKRYRNKNQ